jgi:hypothetical protein
MRITVEAARAFFAHPSQQAFGGTEADLPDWMEYFAGDGVCLALHPAFWPGVWMVHIGAKPAAWGRIDAECRGLIGEAFKATGAVRLVGWIAEDNRAAISLARRCGFVRDGGFPGVCMMGRGA